jgi:hypothetical protein
LYALSRMTPRASINLDESLSFTLIYDLLTFDCGRGGNSEREYFNENVGGGSSGQLRRSR